MQFLHHRLRPTVPCSVCLPAPYFHHFCAIPMTIVWHASGATWSRANTVPFQVDTGMEGDAAGASSAVPHVIRRQSRGSQALQLARSMGSAGTSPFSSALKGCTGEGINPMTWLHIGTGFTSACKGYICMQGSAALLRISGPHRECPSWQVCGSWRAWSTAAGSLWTPLWKLPARRMPCRSFR